MSQVQRDESPLFVTCYFGEFWIWGANGSSATVSASRISGHRSLSIGRFSSDLKLHAVKGLVLFITLNREEFVIHLEGIPTLRAEDGRRRSEGSEGVASEPLTPSRTLSWQSFRN